MTEPVVKLRDGENCPVYRSRDTQAELLGALADEAIQEAIKKEGLHPSRLILETKYFHGRNEPQTSYAEVRVYDRYEYE